MACSPLAVGLCLLLAACLVVDGEAQGQARVTCPGLQQGVCTTACQLATCGALADFYNTTYNSEKPLDTQPWANSLGWELTKTQSCEQLIMIRSSRPSYCGWYGVTCCTPEGMAAKQCSGVHTVMQLKVQVNGLNGSLDNPGIINNILQLHACGLTMLNLQGNDLSGSMSDAWGQLTNLTHLDLGNNWINGTIPSALRRLKKLEVLALGTNFMSGLIPSWLGELKSLQSLSLGANAGDNPDGTTGIAGSIPDAVADLRQLTLLNLETNALVGTLPPRLCTDSKLTVLKLRFNQLKGAVDQLLNCTMLTQLDISNNQFTGELMGAQSQQWGWPQLAVLDASSNAFEGSIPDALYSLPVVGYLNLANNKLTGRIKRAITLMTYLTELNLNNNQLTGEIDENLFFLPQLRILDLSHNNLTGSISPAVGLTFGLGEFLVDNNGLTGAIPPEMGVVRWLKKVDVRKTNMSCLGSQQAADASITKQAVQQCTTDKLLPCFLEFSPINTPRTDNISCPIIQRRPHAEAVQMCSGDGPMQLAEQAHNLPDTLDDDQAWDVDPHYYQYQGCKCLDGFQDVWLQNHTVLTCTPEQGRKVPVWVITLSALMSFGGFMLLAAAGLLVWLRMTVQLRPRWQREKELIENRKKGMPSGGPATIVVTDIEKYSDLMQISAPLTMKALGIHNSILRRAAAAHAGHVVEQEGDSWSVAFHTPMDAVAFCLQVQQALEKTKWGHEPAKGRISSKFMMAGRENTQTTTMEGSSYRGSNSGSMANQHSHSMLASNNSGQLVPSLGGSNRAMQSAPVPGGTAAAAATAALSGPLPQMPTSGVVPPAAAAALASRPVREARSGQLSGPLFSGLDHLIEGEEMDTSNVKAPSSLNSLLLLRDNSSSGNLGVVERRSVSFDARVRNIYASRPQQYQQAGQQQQQQQQHLQAREASYSSLQSSESIISGSEKGTLQGGSTPNSSARNILATLKARLSQVGSSRGSGSGQEQLGGMRNSSSFTTGTGANASEAAAAAAARLSEDAQLPGSRGLSVTKPRISQASNITHGMSLTGQAHVSSTSRFWSVIGLANAGRGSSGAGQSSSMRGLRVRMGVASGYVPANVNISRCALLELAKAVCDMANGGQILLDAGCFSGVRDRLTELGTIDHKGYNEKLLASATKAMMRQQTTGLLDCMGSVNRCLGRPLDNAADSDALLLDMGQYYLPSLVTVIPAAAGESASAAESSQPSGAAAAASAVAPQQIDNDAAMAAAAAAVYKCACASPSSCQLQLFSILPRNLQNRAKLWMNKLAFKESTQQTSRAYFDAPGTGVADFSATAAASLEEVMQSSLPAVTMVFVAMEGGKSLVRRRQEVARVAHNTIWRLLQVMLLALPERDGRPDGYLCRVQEGDLKYMLAFREPARALEWCLLVQEALLHVPWPKEVLDGFEAAAAAAPAPAEAPTGAPGTSFSSIAGLEAAVAQSAAASGRRRPSLKMGLAEGTPNSILPDHLGRADYFGPSVNLAARMMDAAAHGGQVVASAELAEHIFMTWRFEAELGLYNLPADEPQPAEQQGNVGSFSLHPPAAENHVGQQQQQQQQHPSQHSGSLGSPFVYQVQQQQQQCSSNQQLAVGVPMEGDSGSAVSFVLPLMNRETGKTGAETPHMGSATSGSMTGAGAAGAAAPGSGGASQASGSFNQHMARPSQARQELVRELMQRSNNLVDGTEYPLRIVHVSCQHIGVYAFKGCGELDMVSFSADCMPAQEFPATGPKGGKGAMILPGSGPVVGLQQCTVVLPHVLPALFKAWQAAATIAAAEQHARLLNRQQALAAGQAGSGYSAFLEAPDINRNDGVLVSTSSAAGVQNRLLRASCNASFFTAGASSGMAAGGSGRGTLAEVGAPEDKLAHAGSPKVTDNHADGANKSGSSARQGLGQSSACAADIVGAVGAAAVHRSSNGGSSNSSTMRQLQLQQLQPLDTAGGNGRKQVQLVSAGDRSRGRSSGGGGSEKDKAGRAVQVQQRGGSSRGVNCDDAVGVTDVRLASV